MKKKNLHELIEQLRKDPNVVYWHEIEPQEANTVPMPDSLDVRLKSALEKRGIASLYTHQAAAYEAVRNGKHIVAVTPTASGKTLCYNLPVLQAIAEAEHSRALYLFPTKALAQDQKNELHEIIEEMGVPIYSYTYDGDTAPGIRQKIRQAGHIVITNPDMLHSAILPHHTKWVSLFENLRYVVIDELHTYRGVFGSHVANVIRRLKRICSFYGSKPIFICTSATIANPKELAEHLTGEPMTLINNNGAPRGRKHFVFYNPPVVHSSFNIRASATAEVNRLAKQFLENGIQTIVFARSRVRVELILSHLQAMVKDRLGPKTIRGYRGGYLPKERREIEKGLRSGEIIGVVSTNALELGVDIGQLQACIMTGYPGTVASTWQQAGRAGRRHGDSIVIMVASSNPIDQYIVQHPEYFFDRSPETARINPDNMLILVDHLKCAAYELPFRKGEKFGGLEVEEVLEFLTEQKVLHYRAGKWYWMNDAFPAHNISLRSASQENVVIIDISETANHRVIGEMDRFSAMTLLHEEAIYLHEGVQYQVEKLDWEEKKAYVREVNVEYFTDANLAVQLHVLEEDRSEQRQQLSLHYGDVSVRAMATIFKKIKLSTFENIGSGPIHLPEEELHTSATWIELGEELSDIDAPLLEQVLIGISNVLRHLVPMFVMCDRSDIYVVPQIKAPHSGRPTIFIYDRYPGGIGLSEAVFERYDEMIEKVKQWVENCPCESGCPSCIGIVEGQHHLAKQRIIAFLRQLLANEKG
ncbi:DEAD/DEAH box helicase [Saccharococcus caldoxylosilyticus]|jgi:DEAD/DEAH box helicase domain-containing protein|uniref:DEAD/DEAH box helicase n=1 Tax=Saccharococcus caldoxylosilyticus TaxID=81408 RepID=UPI00031FAB39|nr:DEAD/DEAH box helicase [Parageobacillus caldoxylosilyticus]OQP02558.1 ATP-dependent helicase [Geobacillus sp. 44B]QNU37405.1 DEAD/DEAH box helicase [Geobacillus sp. 44B]QXJ36925.1 ATP-dependent RNA helicase DbpA [Parageobacillus caldoxylosilyticus]BDG35595.1 putative ATP-dependent helicase YprA [Parageobacillus caldoxylosilyticus]BDG39374.1 putative ATP-dependent helicase YprA [Parageobacillus caldoxylosilyticus]